ncbi:M56 family metallopeptidase [Myroides fluvii]|uniref:M56 family metallopeptidase n=1 Tax=Myroides fluvii TaxID=2572594 RepID=UPI00131CC331|nr:M56 family metallopeptidase [Myroides fluvii]
MTPFILYLLKANGLLLLILVFYLLFLRKETFFVAIRYYFLIGIALSLILPLLSYTKTVYVEQTMDWSLLLNQMNEVPDGAMQQSFFEQVDFVALLPYVFGGITFVIGFFFCGTILGLIRHIKQLQLWKVQTNIKVDHTTQEAYSFWNWIVLPSNYKEIGALETIIQHEHIHVQQKHTLDLLVVQLVRRIFWFNPFLLLLERVVRLNLEYIVDQEVTALQNRYDYQMTLVQFEQTKTTSLSLVNSFRSSDLKKRIIMLNQPKSKNMKKSKFVLCLPLAVGFFLLFQVHTKAEIRFVNQETATTKQEPEKMQKASGTTILSNNGEEVNTAQKEVLDDLIQKAKEGRTAGETAEANQRGEGSIYVTTNDPSGKIKMTMNGKELTEEEHRLHTEKRRAEGTIQTYTFTSTGTDSKTRIVINGKEYTMEDFAKIGKEINGDEISYTIDRETLLRDAQRTKEETKKKKENLKREMEQARREMEESRKEMEKSRKDMEASRKDMEKSWKEKEKLRKQELEQIKDKLIIYNGKEMSLEELEKISPTGLGGGNIKIYSTEESIEKYGDKGKNGVIVVTSGTNQVQRIDARGKTINTVSFSSMPDNEISILYVVDGKRIKPSELSTIKSEEIESMNVLKGEMAKEKYGKEGENGVIEIIKKK